jgi:hypothetical protein
VFLIIWIHRPELEEHLALFECIEISDSAITS